MALLPGPLARSATAGQVKSAMRLRHVPTRLLRQARSRETEVTCPVSAYGMSGTDLACGGTEMSGTEPAYGVRDSVWIYGMCSTEPAYGARGGVGSA
eukprot:2717733-Rhodomonas_salina.2